MTTTIYIDAKQLGLQIDNWQSDLYILSTLEAHDLIRCHKPKNVSYFTGNDGLPWIEIPFAFDPFWSRR